MKIQVTVKPGAKQEKIEAFDDGLVIYLHARAHDGEANAALVELLSDYFHVAKSLITIKSGAGSRVKVVEVLR